MKKLRAVIIGLVTACLVALPVQAVLVTAPVQAVDVFNACSGAADSAVCKAQGDKLFGSGGLWNRILNVVTFIIGAVAVLMIIIGAMRYTLSGGDQSAVSSAKNTIIYAAVGLILAALANAIVNFVLTNI